MGVLRISLFGGIEVNHPAGPSAVKITRTVQGLLAYLVLGRHRHHSRDELAGTFWGEHPEDRARSCLSTALWRLRRVVEPEGTPRGTYLQATPAGDVWFDSKSDHWLDVAVFEERIRSVTANAAESLESPAVDTLNDAIELYTGDLLEGFYDDWALRERERFRHLYVNSLAYLIRYHKHHKHYEEALACGERILALDPLREEIHREMMRLYAESGNRALAVRQYEACREILATELGIAPMEETEAAHAAIVSHGIAHPVPPTVPDTGSDLDEALQQLRLAMQEVQDARERLSRAIPTVERIVEGRASRPADPRSQRNRPTRSRTGDRQPS